MTVEVPADHHMNHESLFDHDDFHFQGSMERGH